jgi:hypothetical protein
LWGERIAEKRVTVPDACVSGYALADETRVIDLPASDAHPLRIGKTGKERNSELGLTEPGRHLLQLQLLGWRAPGFSIETRPSVQCLRSGWVRLDANAIAVPRSILAKGLPHDRTAWPAQTVADAEQSGHRTRCPSPGISVKSNAATKSKRED